MSIYQESTVNNSTYVSTSVKSIAKRLTQAAHAKVQASPELKAYECIKNGTHTEGVFPVEFNIREDLMTPCYQKVINEIFVENMNKCNELFSKVMDFYAGMFKYCLDNGVPLETHMYPYNMLVDMIEESMKASSIPNASWKSIVDLYASMPICTRKAILFKVINWWHDPLEQIRRRCAGSDIYEIDGTADLMCIDMEWVEQILCEATSKDILNDGTFNEFDIYSQASFIWVTQDTKEVMLHLPQEFYKTTDALKKYEATGLTFGHPTFRIVDAEGTIHDKDNIHKITVSKDVSIENSPFELKCFYLREVDGKKTDDLSNDAVGAVSLPDEQLLDDYHNMCRDQNFTKEQSEGAMRLIMLSRFGQKRADGRVMNSRQNCYFETGEVIKAREIAKKVYHANAIVRRRLAKALDFDESEKKSGTIAEIRHCADNMSAESIKACLNDQISPLRRNDLLRKILRLKIKLVDLQKMKSPRANQKISKVKVKLGLIKRELYELIRNRNVLRSKSRLKMLLIDQLFVHGEYLMDRSDRGPQLISPADQDFVQMVDHIIDKCKQLILRHPKAYKARHKLMSRAYYFLPVEPVPLDTLSKKEYAIYKYLAIVPGGRICRFHWRLKCQIKRRRQYRWAKLDDQKEIDRIREEEERSEIRQRWMLHQGKRVARGKALKLSTKPPKPKPKIDLNQLLTQLFPLLPVAWSKMPPHPKKKASLDFVDEFLEKEHAHEQYLKMKEAKKAAAAHEKKKEEEEARWITIGDDRYSDGERVRSSGEYKVKREVFSPEQAAEWRAKKQQVAQEQSVKKVAQKTQSNKPKVSVDSSPKMDPVVGVKQNTQEPIRSDPAQIQVQPVVQEEVVPTPAPRGLISFHNYLREIRTVSFHDHLLHNRAFRQTKEADIQNQPAPLASSQPVPEVKGLHPVIYNQLGQDSIFMCAGKDKRPLRPLDLYSGSVVEPKDWGTIDMVHEAQAMCQENGCYVPNLGVVLSIDHGDKRKLACVDLDHCVQYVDENGQPHLYKAAQEIVDHLNSYTEVSRSGTGVHIFTFAKDLPSITYCKSSIEDPDTKETFGFELYTDKRYIILTGDIRESVLGERSIMERSADMMGLYQKYRKDGNQQRKQNKVPSNSNISIECSNVSDKRIQGVLNSIRRVAKGTSKGAQSARIFLDLYETGDWEHGKDQYGKPWPSHSEPDQFMLTQLACYCGNDLDLMKAVFLKSAMIRDKDTKHNQYYLDMSIQAAIAYHQNQNNGKFLIGDGNVA